MATLTTRILSTRKERLVATLLLALAVPCAAQIGVILGMLAWVSFPAVLLLFAILALQMLFVGWIADKTLPGTRSDFVVELPPMRLPVLGNLLRKTWSRVVWFLREAVPLFILGTAILFALDRLYILPLIVRAAEPVVVGLLNLPAKAAEAFVMGFLRRGLRRSRPFRACPSRTDGSHPGHGLLGDHDPFRALCGEPFS